MCGSASSGSSLTAICANLRQKYAEQIDVYEDHLRYLDDELVQELSKRGE